LKVGRRRGRRPTFRLESEPFVPRVTRSFNTDLSELAYQIGRSDAFERIQREFKSGQIDDQEAQERVLDLIDAGICRFFGDHGPEEWTWKLNEAEMGKLASMLYRERLGAS
jgi:hypothetical protein